MDENLSTGNIQSSASAEWDESLSGCWDDEDRPDESSSSEGAIDSAGRGGKNGGDAGINSAGGRAKADPPSAQSAGTGESYTLKHLDRILSVGRDELVKLAQKGLDYDRIKAKYTELREFKEENSGAAAFVSELARRKGISVRELLSSARAKGSGDNAAERQIPGTKDADAGEKVSLGRDRDIEEFVAAHPGVRAEDIPESVWQEVSRGQSLLAAYTLHENKRLRSELEALRQNTRNRSLSVTSRASAGSRDSLGEFERLWYAEE